MASPWFQFRFEPPPMEPPELRPVNVAEVILRSQRTHIPLNLAGACEGRRVRVRNLVCRKGRVCSGTFACPCEAENHKPQR